MDQKFQGGERGRANSTGGRWTVRDHCRDLGSLAELDAVEDLVERDNGAARQVVVYGANHDLREVMAEIVAATAV
jgi:carboxylate-amine ligase